MIETLKPCPFCGDTNLEFSEYAYVKTLNGQDIKVAPRFFILCHSCGLFVERTEPGITEADKKALISDWNRRADEYEEA